MSGLAIKVDELEALKLAHMTKQEVAHTLAGKWIESKQAQKVFSEVKISPDEVKKIVMDRLADVIIQKWKEEE